MRHDDKFAYAAYELVRIVVVILSLVGRAGRVAGELMTSVPFCWAQSLFSSVRTTTIWHPVITSRSYWFPCVQSLATSPS